jgi:CDP-diacylglycerol--glycerol-3-phosphate 3-phosphatidyltransferase
MKKQIANLMTGCRILCSIGMVFCPVRSVGFSALYLLCGFTDMVDGTIARKTGSVSNFGAKLDTVADLVFVAAASVKILPVIHLPGWLWKWIAAIGAIRIIMNLWSILYRKTVLSMHTVANKLTGLCLFLLPVTMPFVALQYSAPIVCAMATVSAIQEGYYMGAG